MGEVQSNCRTERPMPAGAEKEEATQAALSSLHLLVGTLAHSLRGHLTGVDGGLYLIQSGRSRGDDARLEKGLAMLQRNLEKIRRAVTHILYYARDREPVREPLSPEALARELAEAVAKWQEPSGARFEWQVAPDAGPVEADRKAIFSALLNVLAYAFEAAPACGQPGASEAATVRLKMCRTSDEMLLTVEAPGKSLDAQTREKILSPYWLAKMEDTARLARGKQNLCSARRRSGNRLPFRQRHNFSGESSPLRRPGGRRADGGAHEPANPVRGSQHGVRQGVS